MDNAQVETNPHWFKYFMGKLRRYTWPITSKIAWVIYQRVGHCDSPEYFSAHPKMVRWTGGLRAATWSHVCGHGLGFSFRMGNIYWRLNGRDIDNVRRQVNQIFPVRPESEKPGNQPGTNRSLENGPSETH